MTSEEQAVGFLLAVLLGAGLGILFDGWRTLRSLRSFGMRRTAAGDLLFWLAASPISLLVLGMATDGELRGYFFLGMAAGGAVYFGWGSRRMRCIWLFFARTAQRLIRFAALLGRWLLLPLRTLCRFAGWVRRRITAPREPHEKK